jgi:hypothetical protein
MHSIIRGKQRRQREKDPKLDRHHQISTEPNIGDYVVDFDKLPG